MNRVLFYWCFIFGIANLAFFIFNGQRAISMIVAFSCFVYVGYSGMRYRDTGRW